MKKSTESNSNATRGIESVKKGYQSGKRQGAQLCIVNLFYLGRFYENIWARKQVVRSAPGDRGRSHAHETP